MLLSIVIPFYNTFQVSIPLLIIIKKSLTLYKDIEFILVNDGSTDNTYESLQNYFQAILPNQSLKLITQKNLGPGAARNNGLRNAKGKYIWFVDSDDVIDLDIAFNSLKEVISLNKPFDFIDFNYTENGKVINSMKTVGAGYHEQFTNKYTELGRLWTKIFDKRIFTENNVQYLEHCFYEDNYLIFILPLFLNRFFKFDRVAYEYMYNPASITTQSFNRKYYDRLLTAYKGIIDHYAIQRTLDKGAITRFNEIFLIRTVSFLVIGMFIKRTIPLTEIRYLFATLSWYYYLKSKYDLHDDNGVNLSLAAQWFFSCTKLLFLFLPKKDYYKTFEQLNMATWNRE